MPRPPSRPAKESTSNPNSGVEDFSAHFTRSFRVLWLIAAGILGDRSLADDVLQEAAMIALTKYEQFQPGTNFTAWMGQVVRHVSLNMARKERRRRPSGSLENVDSSDLGDLHSSPSEERLNASVSMTAAGRLPENQTHFDDQIMSALGRLGEAPRACLLLRTIEGLEYSEISQLLEIPEGTAMSHVHRARKFLLTCLTPLSSIQTEKQTGPSDASLSRKKGDVKPS